MAYIDPTITAEELQSERWRTIEEFPNCQVSNLGRIRYRMTGNLRGGSVSGRGYKQITLTKGKTFYVHVLVAKAFLRLCPASKHEVNHIDANRMNNRAENLEWVTHSENVLHAIKLGRWNPPKGEQHSEARFTESEVREIRQSKETDRRLAERYGVTHTAIYKIKNRLTWKSVE